MDVSDSKELIPKRLNRIIRDGITAYWTLFNSDGKPVVGLPVTDKDYKIMVFKTEAEAELEANKFMGF
ncbi:MAG TPA: hypothetical protein VL728_19405 [Cyclobacteriaceae bacterium]|nr:hypothetical protein [Cyclobacteriaceae bacterium]